MTSLVVKIHHLKTSTAPLVVISSSILCIARSTFRRTNGSIAFREDSASGLERSLRSRRCVGTCLAEKTPAFPGGTNLAYQGDLTKVSLVEYMICLAATSAMSTSEGLMRTTEPTTSRYLLLATRLPHVMEEPETYHTSHVDAGCREVHYRVANDTYI
jgi:hypothetical protein